MWMKISGALLLLACLLGSLYGLQRHSLAKARGEAKEATEVAQSLSQELVKTQQSYRVDLDAIHNAQDTKDNLVANATAVKEKVDAVAKKVESGQLSDAAGDAAYYDSMLQVYCQGASDVETCSGRPSPRH